MKKYVSLILSLVIVFSVAGYSIAEKEAKSPSEVTQTDTNEVQYELIMNAFHFENKIFKPNAALLISDKKEIKTDAEIFLAKRSMYHLCGYHYRFLFWINTDSLLEDISLNQNCESFGYKADVAHKKLAYYVKLLETAPTHYIYSLEIPVSMEPNEIREKFKNSKLNLFFIDGEKTRFPSIRFEYRHTQFVGKDAKTKDWTRAGKENEEAAKKKFKELVEKIKLISSIVEESDIYNTLSGGLHDSVYRKDYMTLIFEKGTDLSKVITILEHEGAKIYYADTPSTYLVQVVDTSADIKYIEDKLKKYEFIKGITEYKKDRW